jgi:hypothetical protein
MRWLVVAACFAVACKSKQAPKRDDARVAPADAAAADATLDAPAPPDAATLAMTITGDGVGPITADVDDEEELAKRLPGFKVSSEHHSAEDFEYDELTATKDGKRVLRAVVIGNKLFKVVVYDPMFATESGVTVNMTAGNLAAKVKDLECVYEKYTAEDDAERVDRSLRCQSESLPRVMFEIDHDKLKLKLGQVSPKAIADRTIEEIVWLASSE